MGAIDTPIGYIPRYEDLHDQQFAFYLDNILGRIELQEAAYRTEKNVPAKLIEVYEEQRAGLEALKARYGSVVTAEQLVEAAGS